MPGITVTGVDERTPLDAIQGLLDLGAEVGFLYTETPEGRSRYPSPQWIADMAWRCRGGRLSLHVCGSKARLLLLEHRSGLAHDFDRVQINGRVSPFELATARNEYVQELITQNSPGNAELLNAPALMHAILVDGSGGRGIAPDVWTRSSTDKRVGFAGGLSPHNLAVELPKIAAVATGDWWVDMETGVRTDDWFDAQKALECVRIFNEFIQGQV